MVVPRLPYPSKLLRDAVVNKQNWVGLLSRGILLPEAVTKLGVVRTDFGWLGAGIYFGDVLETSLNYAEAGSRGTSMVAIANVALGKVWETGTVDGSIKHAPKGFDSIHGDPNLDNSGFADNEYCM